VNILITSASRKVSLVRAFQRALSKEGGGKVVAADISARAAALYLADDYVLLPRQDAPTFWPEMENVCVQHEIKLVIPTRDGELLPFARHRSWFAKRDLVVMTATPEVIALCQDKMDFAQFCRRHAFEIPLLYAEGAHLPLFGRPRVGAGARGVGRIDTTDDLAAALRLGKIIQEYVDLPEYTIDVYVKLDSTVVSAIPRRRVQVMGGESFIGVTHKHSGLIGEAIRLSRALGLVGHNTIQCFLDGDAVKFFEVNPRYGGGAALGIAAGAPTPRYLVRELQHKMVPSRIGQFTDGLAMLRYTEDIFLRPGGEETAANENRANVCQIVGDIGASNLTKKGEWFLNLPQAP